MHQRGQIAPFDHEKVKTVEFGWISHVTATSAMTPGAVPVPQGAGLPVAGAAALGRLGAGCGRALGLCILRVVILPGPAHGGGVTSSGEPSGGVRRHVSSSRRGSAIRS
ncbi:unnamed protein product [Phytophthora fragariaefolia]|uniref:Unnamed protein product n=1 Tax=Phytophthora fragariaefolia TaxID=1490495 RepID=A0A9W6YCG2_9STRA|nr:unnamed protein product [Phytophthora fragariaefolia]